MYYYITFVELAQGLRSGADLLHAHDADRVDDTAVGLGDHGIESEEILTKALETGLCPFLAVCDILREDDRVGEDAAAEVFDGHAPLVVRRHPPYGADGADEEEENKDNPCHRVYPPHSDDSSLIVHRAFILS